MNTTKQSAGYKRAMDVALESLKRIEVHEKECAERWAEAIVEIKHLQELTSSHSLRWEKLAWLVVAAVTVHIISGMF